jgi:hypothetical protein
MDVMDEATEIKNEFKAMPRKIKKKVEKTPKGKFPTGAVVVMLLIVVFSLFAGWYFPRMGQPIFGWSEDQTLTAQYYTEYATAPTTTEYVVLVDGAINTSCSYIAVYERVIGGYWNVWVVNATGYYNFDETVFYFD